MSKILQLKDKKFVANRQEMFAAIMTAVDFTVAKNSLDAVKILFDYVYPVIERLTNDNMDILEDQKQQMVQVAELDEKYKKLETDYQNLKEAYENSLGEYIPKESFGTSEKGQGDLFLQKGGDGTTRDT